MTAATLNMYRTFLYNEKGEPVIVQLDLRNEFLKKTYEKVMEEFEDYLDAQEAMTRDDDDTVTWEEVKKGLYSESKQE